MKPIIIIILHNTWCDWPVLTWGWITLVPGSSSLTLFSEEALDCGENSLLSRFIFEKFVVKDDNFFFFAFNLFFFCLHDTALIDLFSCWVFFLSWYFYLFYFPFHHDVRTCLRSIGLVPVLHRLLISSYSRPREKKYFFFFFLFNQFREVRRRIVSLNFFEKVFGVKNKFLLSRSTLCTFGAGRERPGIQGRLALEREDSEWVH